MTSQKGAFCDRAQGGERRTDGGLWGLGALIALGVVAGKLWRQGQIATRRYSTHVDACPTTACAAQSSWR
jgi:hypothetical protein